MEGIAQEKSDRFYTMKCIVYTFFGRIKGIRVKE